MWSYYELCTSLGAEQIAELRRQVAAAELHPKAAKQRLAGIIVGDFHGEQAAAAAQAEFDKIFAEGGLPDEIETLALASGEPAWIVKLMRDCGFASSNGEARRLLSQGAVSLDGERISDETATIPNDGVERVLKVGKRRFARVRVD
jgi:tyrosyl-tRNA synthetase